MLTQKLEQRLLQKLSPQQIQLMKLLQVPALALEERIKQEIESNPALEEGEDAEEDENIDNMSVEDDYDIDYSEEESTLNNKDSKEEKEETIDVEPEFTEIESKTDKEDNEFGFDDYVEDDEYIPAYKTNGETMRDDEKKEIPFSSFISFQDFLISQLGTQPLDDKLYQIGLNIIGNIDESGYMQRTAEAIVNDLVFGQNLVTDPGEVKSVLEIIQKFDPPGVGARNLQECLIIQLKKINNPDKAVLDAINIIENYFDDYIKKHYDKIEQKSGINQDALKEANVEILKLNPKPGSSIEEISKTNQYIIPDFHISNNNDDLILSLSSKNSPEVKLSKSYLEMLDTYSKGKNHKGNKDAVTFVKQKLESARWFIDALKQRENTLYQTMFAIMNFQKEFFLTGDETTLKPMILRDIANIVKLDISTVSRVANSKYVQTPYGTFPLKNFFSEATQNNSGEEISTREVKKILQDCLNVEDKKNPITDDELAEILKEKGYNIARRTVAKYREHLNIPVARLRKKL